MLINFIMFLQHIVSAAISHHEESQSTPALIHIPEASSLGPSASSLGIIPENNLLQSYTRLSISLEENGLFKVTLAGIETTRFFLYTPPPPLTVN